MNKILQHIGNLEIKRRIAESGLYSHADVTTSCKNVSPSIISADVIHETVNSCKALLIYRFLQSKR